MDPARTFVLVFVCNSEQFELLRVDRPDSKGKIQISTFATVPFFPITDEPCGLDVLWNMCRVEGSMLGCPLRLVAQLDTANLHVLGCGGSSLVVSGSKGKLRYAVKLPLVAESDVAIQREIDLYKKLGESEQADTLFLKGSVIKVTVRNEEENTFEINALQLVPVCSKIEASKVTMTGVSRCLEQLQVLHNLSYLHCDIREPNVMYDNSTETMCLVDLGNAIEVSATKRKLPKKPSSTTSRRIVNTAMTSPDRSYRYEPQDDVVSLIYTLAFICYPGLKELYKIMASDFHDAQDFDWQVCQFWSRHVHDREDTPFAKALEAAEALQSGAPADYNDIVADLCRDVAVLPVAAPASRAATPMIEEESEEDAPL
jgi:serine/threonine protein kinase